MKCIGIGEIQAYIDGEPDISRKKEIEHHLETCEKCAKEFEKLKTTDNAVFEKLSVYNQFCAENYKPSGKCGNKNTAANPSPRKTQETQEKSKAGWFIIKYKKAISAACVAVILTLCVAVQPVRAFISEALNIFRVENVKSLQISFSDMEDIRRQLEQKTGDIELDQFGKIESEGFAEQKLSVREAKALEDPAVLLPPEAKEDNIDIHVTQSGLLSFTMDVENVNEALKSFGAEKLLPGNLNGKTFTAQFAAQVEYLYHEDGGFYSVMQTRTPELAVPADVDVDQMYDCLAELPILPEDMRHQLKSIQDWKNTIYLPVAGEPQEVVIQGAKGFIAEKKNGGWMLVWYDGGTLFSVEGNAGKEELTDFAESLR
jgi:hypothetical protein